MKNRNSNSKSAVIAAIAVVTVLAAGFSARGPGLSDACAQTTQVPLMMVSPQAGTVDASPATQISVLGVPAQAIRSVTAVGSVSGAHTGQIKSYSNASGASFVPDAPFRPGEAVSVTVIVAGFPPVFSSFTVGALVPLSQIPTTDLSHWQPDKLDHFVTRPDLLPPKISVSLADPNETSEIFLTPIPAPVLHPAGAVTLNAVGPGGPMLLDGQGRTLWFKQLPPSVVASDLKPATYNNQPVLTWWQGVVAALAFGVGKGVIADSSYHTIAEVNAGNGYAADTHEFTVTPDGDALLVAFEPILPAGSAPGQPVVIDWIIQQIDIKTGLVKWEWHALGHVPTSDAYVPVVNGIFDPYHLNSVQALPDGTVLASMRDTSAIYRIDKSSGNIVWTLGGKESTFSFGAGARFWFQHDARMLSSNTISLFDNEGGPPDMAATSRGLILSLDLTNKVASVAAQYTRPQPTLAESQGNTQILDNGNVFVGFGSQPNFSEFTAGGTMIFDAALPVDDGNYRVVRGTWDATPDTVPDAAAVRTSATDVTVYASWNGATKVAHWQVLAGDSVSSLAPAATAAWSGFETSIPVSTKAGTFKVQALDTDGNLLATSAAVTAP